jgi:hypothetical protein
VSRTSPLHPPFARSRYAATLALPTVALAALAACSKGAAPEPEPGTPPVVAAGRKAVLAPIERAELVTRESQPPQYAVLVASGLPSGCAKFERIDLARDGYVVNLSVWNTMPADPGVACTMIYGTAEHTVDLGPGLVRGEAYAVHVNGEPKLTLTPQ